MAADPAPGQGAPTDRLADLYGARYYETYIGEPYERSSPQWQAFFGGIADHIVADIGPRTVLDAGCAKGMLVEALRDRGVEAFGIDVSEYAIGEVRVDVRPFCRVASIADELDRDYDLIVSMEVLEHVSEQVALEALANICRHTDDVLFSSSPDEYGEATHINLHPTDWWMERFARHGFFCDVDYDPTPYLAAWARRVRRRRDPVERVVGEFDRAVHRARLEARDRQELVLKQEAELKRQADEIAQLRGQLDRTRAEVARELDPMRTRIAQLEQENAEAYRRLAHSGVRRLLPADTARGRAARAMRERLRPGR